MTNSLRHYNFLDHCLMKVDQGLKTLSIPPVAKRHSPASKLPKAALTNREVSSSIALMRVNHAGEVSAQALYQAQALMAKKEAIKFSLQQSAIEESDHLAWCADRIHQLGGRTSYLNPLWYLGSFAIGIMAGFAGDAWSLGFIAETERQVVEHLNKHLQVLPAADSSSQAILTQMSQDEALHASVALTAGAKELPQHIKTAMHYTAQFMVKTAYWV
jgi:ubiquinone biosynthesis monooxygenase Coq7